MRQKDFITGLRRVLLEARHDARTGSVVWWCGLLVLRPRHQSGGLGYVLGGSPLAYREIEEETGFNWRTLKGWILTLRSEGYIETQQDRGGVAVFIRKAKKHRKPTSLTLATNRKGPRAGVSCCKPRAVASSEVRLGEGAESRREFVERGRSIGMAARAYPAQMQTFAAEHSSADLAEIRKKTEAETRDAQISRATTPRCEESVDISRDRVECSDPRVKPSCLETNQTKSKILSASTTDGEIRYANFATTSLFADEIKTTTPSPRHGFTPVFNPNETKLPWELHKQMQLERAARYRELRRELHVGTGPEGRRT